MENVFGSPKINRKLLAPNKRTGIKQEFFYDANTGFKSVAKSNIVSWPSSGKGVQGETINSKNNASRLVINRNWKPIQS